MFSSNEFDVFYKLHKFPKVNVCIKLLETRMCYFKVQRKLSNKNKTTFFFLAHIDLLRNKKNMYIRINADVELLQYCV